MFHPMIRTDRKISKDAALEILAKGSYGVLCTIGENGYPSGTPLNYADDGENIYVHFAAGSVIKNAALNPKVCFTVVTRNDVLPQEFTTNYESVMAFGTAKEVHGQEKYDALHLLVKKYSVKFEKEGAAYIGKSIDNCRIFKIKIEHIFSS